MPYSPGYLTDVGKKEWTRMGRFLRDKGLLTETETLAFSDKLTDNGVRIFSAASGSYIGASCPIG